jgi:alcohol dehydrogenase class IV
LPSRLRDAGLSETILDPVASGALKNPLLGHNPRPITTFDEARAMLRRAY